MFLPHVGSANHSNSYDQDCLSVCVSLCGII